MIETAIKEALEICNSGQDLNKVLGLLDKGFDVKINESGNLITKNNNFDGFCSEECKKYLEKISKQ